MLSGGKEADVPQSVEPGVTFPLVREAGGLLFLSGMTSWQPAGTLLGGSLNEVGTISADIRVQTRAVIENMRTVLAAAGSRLADLVSVTSFLATMSDFAAYNEVWAEHFDASGPARATVAVHQLAHPAMLIEMQGIAVRGG